MALSSMQKIGIWLWFLGLAASFSAPEAKAENLKTNRVQTTWESNANNRKPDPKTKVRDDIDKLNKLIKEDPKKVRAEMEKYILLLMNSLIDDNTEETKENIRLTPELAARILEISMQTWYLLNVTSWHRDSWLQKKLYLESTNPNNELGQNIQIVNYLLETNPKLVARKMESALYALSNSLKKVKVAENGEWNWITISAELAKEIQLIWNFTTDWMHSISIQHLPLITKEISRDSKRKVELSQTPIDHTRLPIPPTVKTQEPTNLD